MTTQRLAAATTPSSLTGEGSSQAAGLASDGRAEPGGRMTGRGASKWIGLCFIAPLIAFLALVYVVPLARRRRMERHAAQARASDNTSGSRADPLVLSVFLRTFRICAIVTATSVAAAYAIAYVWVRGTRMQRRLTELCILIPFLDLDSDARFRLAGAAFQPRARQ